MSFLGKIVGGAIGFVVAGPAGAVAGAAIGGSKAASDAADTVGQAAKYTEEFIEGVGKVIVAGGVFIIDAVSDVAQAIFNVAEGVVAFRPLRPSELNVARQMFGASIPLEKVVISTLIGLGNRPFTIPGSLIMSSAWAIPGIGPVLEVAYLLQGLSDKYVIFAGRDGYNHALNMPFDMKKKGQTLMHELTHVWQGHHQDFQWSYILNSLWKQCECCPNFKLAYRPAPGSQWRDYTAEQQAVLIEGWYVNNFGVIGRSAFASEAVLQDQLEAYMASNIRPGLPYATTVFPNKTHVVDTGISLLRKGVFRTGPLLNPAGAINAPRVSPFKFR